MAKLTEGQRAERAAKRRFREALEAEDRAIRERERDARWEREDTRLTWEEVQQGISCRGCGKTIMDGLGEFPPRMHETPEQTAAREADEAAYRERHSGCKAHRWSVQGSRTIHCGWCCPPPPFNPAKAAELAQLIRNLSRHPALEHEYVTWRLSLTCGHVADKRARQSNHTYSSSTLDCAECGAVRGIVDKMQLPRSGVAVRH
ncbi:hypothetical protein ACFYXQ_03850 [Nocardia jiangxiensis]|uniref:Recombination endonuclease VII n=1 Tax=Nocardia jiangxiensis TaxID=282685 RepID=A0ABW6RSB5_9NOCA